MAKTTLIDAIIRLLMSIHSIALRVQYPRTLAAREGILSGIRQLRTEVPVFGVRTAQQHAANWLGHLVERVDFRWGDDDGLRASCV